MNTERIHLPQYIGKGYKRFWTWKGRNRVCKGSRASKKSKTMALWCIVNLMKYPAANLLVVRKSYRTLKDSCFAELKWAIHRLKVDAFWDFRLNPLEMTYKPTGQKIYFRGLDDPLKITSITVDIGVLCWLWIEEAYEITRESDFDTINESIRGEVPPGLFKQVTLTFNPWNERHWLKAKFFDNPDEETLAMTTNYMCNEWLDKSDIALFESMKKNNPRRYRVAGLGEWGIVDGLIYENWHEEQFTIMNKGEYNKLPEEERPEDVIFADNIKSAYGLDFGYTNDPSAFFVGFLDVANKKLYVYDEFYEKGLSNKAINEKIVSMGYAKARITADSAEPKSIDELRGFNLRVSPAKKGRDSVMNGVQWIQDLEIIVHPRCVNFITEISNYTWDKDKFGNKINRPIDDFNHLMDAMRYALEQFIKNHDWII